VGGGALLDLVVLMLASSAERLSALSGGVPGRLCDVSSDLPDLGGLGGGIFPFFDVKEGRTESTEFESWL
jgi:hypothetical protein